MEDKKSFSRIEYLRNLFKHLFGRTTIKYRRTKSKTIVISCNRYDNSGFNFSYKSKQDIEELFNCIYDDNYEKIEFEKSNKNSKVPNSIKIQEIRDNAALWIYQEYGMSIDNIAFFKYLKKNNCLNISVFSEKSWYSSKKKSYFDKETAVRYFFKYRITHEEYRKIFNVIFDCMFSSKGAKPKDRNDDFKQEKKNIYKRIYSEVLFSDLEPEIDICGEFSIYDTINSIINKSNHFVFNNIFDLIKDFKIKRHYSFGLERNYYLEQCRLHEIQLYDEYLKQENLSDTEKGFFQLSRSWLLDKQHIDIKDFRKQYSNKYKKTILDSISDAQDFYRTHNNSTNDYSALNEILLKFNDNLSYCIDIIEPHLLSQIRKLLINIYDRYYYCISLSDSDECITTHKHLLELMIKIDVYENIVLFFEYAHSKSVLTYWCKYGFIESIDRLIFTDEDCVSAMYSYLQNHTKTANKFNEIKSNF